MERIYRRYRSFAQWSLVRFGVDGDHVDDALQDVFLRVLSCAASQRGTRTPLGSWIWGICRNVASSYRRKASRRADEYVTLSQFPPHHGTDPEEACVRAEALEMLEAFLDELESDKRELFLLTEIDDLPAAEAASRLGINVNTAYSRLRVARSQFERRSRVMRARDRHAAQRIAAGLATRKSGGRQRRTQPQEPWLLAS